MDLLLSCTWLAAVGWLIFRAFQQRHLLRPIVASPPPPAKDAPRVSIIVPARDEEQNIGQCLQALVRQDYPMDHLSVLLIDDHSADATVAIARAFAVEYPHVRIVRAPPLPPRWIGKSHACWIGAREAGENTDWLCFVDADVRAEPALLASALAAARAEELDVLSLAPRQELGSFAERLIIPCGLYLLAFCQDLRRVQSRRGADATATGQFMLIRHGAYAAVGGHAAIRGAICEDLELARLIKRSGGAVILRDGNDLISTRMYLGWRTLWPGIAKNLVEMLGGTRRVLAVALIATVLAWSTWLIPLAEAVRCSHGSAPACLALYAALAGSAAAIALHTAGARHFRIAPWYGLLFPFGYSAGALIALDSVLRRWRGRVTWKGRTYP